MSLQVVLPPVADPVSLAETKKFLQVDSDHEDGLIADLIAAATEAVERRTGLILISRTLRQTVKVWPEKGVFALQAAPLIQLLQVQFFDAMGAAQLVDSTAYYVDVQLSRLIALAAFPSLPVSHPAQAIEIDFTAGYGTSPTALPASLRIAVLLVVRDIYEHRGERDGTLLLRAQALLAPFTQVRL